MRRKNWQQNIGCIAKANNITNNTPNNTTNNTPTNSLDVQKFIFETTKRKEYA